MDITSDLNKALEEYRKAQMLMREKQYDLEQGLLDCLDMTIGEAICLNIVRFNFPTSASFRRHINSRKS